MSNAGPSRVSQGSLLDLKAITAEHVDRFAKEGRTAVKGQAKRTLDLDKAKDPFDRPSPGLVKRLAAEARNDAKRRHFQDEGGPSDEQRRAIMKAKAKKYEAMRRGDYSSMTERELAESVIDFERKLEEEDGWSDHSSDVDESALAPRRTRDDESDEDDLAQVEYVDELGRTRVGTRKDAKDAERAKRKEEPAAPVMPPSAYAEVLESNIIHGDQNIFPVYEPDPDALRQKYREAQEAERAHHYDSTKEVRARGAGAYQFSLDEEERARQMTSLEAQRVETERARSETSKRAGMSAAQEARKRKLDERKALIEAKRAKMLGGQDEVERLRKEKKEKEAEAFLSSLEADLVVPPERPNHA